MQCTVLFGSEMGTAESAADAIADTLTADGLDVSLYDMFDFDVDDLDPQSTWIIVSSTYGTGEVPTPAEQFYDALIARTPDLTGLRFAVFGLGDSVYQDTFNRGGELFAEKLTELGAAQFGEHARHDGSGTLRAADHARQWATTLAQTLAATAAN